jgi:Mg-chelatase subunit ChlD
LSLTQNVKGLHYLVWVKKMAEQDKRRLRWRLLLGESTEDLLGGLSAEWQDRETAIGYLYDRENADRNIRKDQQDRAGSLDPSELTVPDWINAVHELFPQKTIERLEKDALERYHLEEMVTNPDLLSRVKPSPTLLKAVLRTKHLMNQAVLEMARELVRKVVEQLMETLARSVQSPFLGSINRQQRSYLKVAKNFDARTTVRRNLRNYNPDRQQLVIETPYFNSRVRRQADKWQMIILVDESGSMLDSVIHSAVTAAIFFGVKSLKTHLCLFDTSVVDVTADCTDPVETLMKVQLGGGTDIGGALSYATTLVENPRRTIVVLITDFYEGAPIDRLLSVTKQLVESGVNLLGLAALDGQANPNYDRDLAQQMVNLGAQVGAMTPGELAAWVAEKVK